MTTTKTIEQLQAEANAAAEALAAARIEAERAAKAKEDEERRAKFAAEQKARQERLAKMLEPISAALAGVEHELVMPRDEFSEPWIRVLVPGAKSDVALKPSYRNGGRFSRGTLVGYSVVVGPYDDAKRFPPTAKGHSYEKIAAEVKSRIERAASVKAAQQARADKRKEAEARAAAVRAATGSESDAICGAYDTGYHDFQRRWHSNVSIAEEGNVFVKVGTLQLSTEKAIALVAALRHLGVKV